MEFDLLSGMISSLGALEPWVDRASNAELMTMQVKDLQHLVARELWERADGHADRF